MYISKINIREFQLILLDHITNVLFFPCLLNYSTYKVFQMCPVHLEEVDLWSGQQPVRRSPLVG